MSSCATWATSWASDPAVNAADTSGATDVAVGTLRLRGPLAQRLAEVAARRLPDALGRALSDLGDVEVPHLVVALDASVAEHDDETLAVLWADAVRTELLAVGASARRASRGAATAAGSSPGRDVAPASAEEVAGVARRWLAGDRSVVPGPLLRLAEPGLARRVAARLGPEAWADLVAAFVALGRRPGAPTGPGTARRGAASPGSGPAAGYAASGAPAAPGNPPARTDPPEAPAELRALADLASNGVPRWPGVTPERATDSAPTDLDPTTLTRAAGLVLVYPWLGDHAEAAAEQHPELDPVEVREAALALVADPAEPGLVHDPLVRLLAGREDPLAGSGGRPGDAPRAPLPREDEVRASAEALLASFAALLPGFADSSADFVRQAWVQRLGLLEPDTHPARLTAATHPLDVVLSALPYPRELVRLRWSPLLSVRFRP